MITRAQYEHILFYIFYGGLALIIIGLYFSRAILSIGTGIVIGIPFLQPQFVNRLHKYFENKPALAISGIFVMYLLSGLNSTNQQDWIEKVRINIPTLLMPLSFMLMKPIPRRTFQLVLYLYMIVTTISVCIVLANYIIFYETITATYLQGQVMPTPVIYVRYSLMVAIAIIIAIYLLSSNFLYKYSWEKYLIAVLGAFLIVFIHLLAVRTGLLALYVALITTTFYYFFHGKHRRWGFVLLGMVIMLPLFLYFIFPTLQNKIQYVIWDWKMYLSGDEKWQPSDYIRIYSITHGLELVSEQPFFGVGIGDLKQEMEKKYEALTPHISKSERFLPLNQYVYVMTATGILGLSYFILATWYPVFYRKNYQNYFVLTYHLALFSTFVGETSIELQSGKTVYLFFTLLSLAYLDQDDES